MDPGLRETGMSLCIVRMLPFVAVGTVLAILAIWLLTWADHLVHKPPLNSSHQQ